jgi:hypothetical protein
MPAVAVVAAVLAMRVALARVVSAVGVVLAIV